MLPFVEPACNVNFFSIRIKPYRCGFRLAGGAIACEISAMRAPLSSDAIPRIRRADCTPLRVGPKRTRTVRDPTALTAQSGGACVMDDGFEQYSPSPVAS